jgi:NADPH:quinone reductase-like Zn-dependent oxidoreductase
MQAIRVHELNGIASLRLEEAECPAPGDGELRVAVYAAGCNFAGLRSSVMFFGL